MKELYWFGRGKQAARGAFEAITIGNNSRRQRDPGTNHINALVEVRVEDSSTIPSQLAVMIAAAYRAVDPIPDGCRYVPTRVTA